MLTPALLSSEGTILHLYFVEGSRNKKSSFLKCLFQIHMNGVLIIQLLVQSIIHSYYLNEVAWIYSILSKQYHQFCIYKLIFKFINCLLWIIHHRRRSKILEQNPSVFPGGTLYADILKIESQFREDTHKKSVFF